MQRRRDSRDTSECVSVYGGGEHCYKELQTANCTLHTANCTLQTHRGRDARVPTVHSGGEHCYKKLQTANFKLQTANGKPSAGETPASPQYTLASSLVSLCIFAPLR